MLEIKEVSKIFNKTKKAVNKLTLVLQPGEIYGLLGPNGSGKTTTFRLIMNLLFPDEGYIYWNKKIVNSFFLKQVGYVPEVVSLMKKFKVIDQLIYLGGLKGLSKSEVLAQWENYAELLEISAYKNLKIKQLSKGNVQKIQILVALLHNPSLLILDEPFSGLDVITTNIIKKLILKLKEENKIILFSSHRLDDIEEFCSHITILQNGNIIKQGSIIEIRKEQKQMCVVYEDENMDIQELKKIKDISYSVLSKNAGNIICDNEKSFENVCSFIKKSPTLIKFEIKLPSLSQIFINLMEKKN